MTFFLVPFEVGDGCTVALLEAVGLLFQRNVVFPGLIQYLPRQDEWGELGMIQLKKVDETGCEVTFFGPPAVLDTDAVAFLAQVQADAAASVDAAAADAAASGDAGAAADAAAADAAASGAGDPMRAETANETGYENAYETAYENAYENAYETASGVESEAEGGRRFRLSIWHFYPDFPEVGRDLAHLLNESGGTAGRPGTAGRSGTAGRPGAAGRPGMAGRPGATRKPGAADQVVKFWDGIIGLTQGYLTRKRSELTRLIDQQLTAVLVERQGLSLVERQGLSLVERQGLSKEGGGEGRTLREAWPSRRRPGPKPTTDQVRARIIAEWEKARGFMSQEAFCSREGIGVSTLRAWMRDGSRGRD